MEKQYIAIDLKSFYASVECMERGLDPMTTNLVVADESRTAKTIVLAVSPSLKSYGIPGRPRLFEVIRKIEEENRRRLYVSKLKEHTGTSHDDTLLKKDPTLAVSYIVAPPRMAHYMEYSTRIYQVYLKYIAPEDIHVYSIDEVFIDATPYLHTYQMTARELAMAMIRDVLQTTGITATAGIGSNLYLAKIAMDVMAKKMPADAYGVRIAELDEKSYRKNLWEHKPLTSFWRVGKGTANRLEKHGIYTMGDIALLSTTLQGEELLYSLFGVNAELLIDHAWGYEPTTIAEIKAYRPENNSMCSGQVLQEPYPFDKALVVVKEMADRMALDLVEKRLVTDQLVLTIGFDRENVDNAALGYTGEVVTDRYGRKVPKSAHGTQNLAESTSSSRRITEGAAALFTRITDPHLLIRRISLTANHILPESMAARKEPEPIQLDLFTDYEELERKEAAERTRLEKERRQQEALLKIQGKYGKNAIMKGLNYQEGGTMKERNNQIGGHKA